MMRESSNAYIANYWLSEELISMIQ
jgi:hypothetical protein